MLNYDHVQKDQILKMSWLLEFLIQVYRSMVIVHTEMHQMLKRISKNYEAVVLENE